MSIIIGGLIAELSPGLNVTKSQFVTAIGYGYIIVNCLVVASIFLKDELPKNTVNKFSLTFHFCDEYRFMEQN